MEPEKIMESEAIKKLSRKTKAQIIEKYQNQHIFFQGRIEAERKKRQEDKDEADKAVEQVKQAMQNILSMVARTYGKKQEDGTYKISIPVPEGGWLSLAKKTGNEYEIVAKKIE